MQTDWRYSDTGVNWEELAELYRVAPLGNKKPVELETVFGNSLYKCFVFKEDRLIGAGRALADGGDCAYISDVAVHPDYQGVGIGGKIINYLVDCSSGYRKIILYAAPGKESFYKKLGFSTMCTAMAIFANHDYAKEIGLIKSDPQ